MPAAGSCCAIPDGGRGCHSLTTRIMTVEQPVQWELATQGLRRNDGLLISGPAMRSTTAFSGGGALYR